MQISLASYVKLVERWTVQCKLPYFIENNKQNQYIQHQCIENFSSQNIKFTKKQIAMRANRFNSNTNNNYKSQTQNIFGFLNNFKFSQVDDSTIVLISQMVSDCNKPKQLQGYMVKDIVVQNVEELRQIQKTLKIHLEFPKQLFMPLLDYQITYNEANQTQKYNLLPNQNELDGNFILIRAIYQYSPFSLQAQLRERIFAKCAFVEEELWHILTSLVQSLAFLQRNQIVYGVLGLDRVLASSSNKGTNIQQKCQKTNQKMIPNKKKIRLLDPSAAAMNPLQILPDRVYSPQVKIYNYQSNVFQSSRIDGFIDEVPNQIDMFKSDVYVLGLCILQLGLLMDFNMHNLCQEPAFSTINSQKAQDGTIIKNIKVSQIDQQICSDDECSNDSFNPSRIRISKQKQEPFQQRVAQDNTIKFANISARRNQLHGKSQMFHFSPQQKSKASLNPRENLQLTIPFHLAEFTHNYSEELATLVKSMLSALPEHRPNFIQIQNHLIDLSNRKNIAGISIALNRQTSNNKKQSALLTILQPSENDAECQPDRLVNMQFAEERQIPDCKDQDIDEQSSDRSQKCVKKGIIKHSLSQKKKHQKLTYKITQYERARQNFIGHQINNQQYYEQATSAQKTSSNDISGSPHQNSCSEQSLLHQESCEIRSVTKECRKLCDHCNQQIRRESKKEYQENYKKICNCKSKSSLKKQVIYRTKKSNGSHQPSGLQFKQKKYKCKDRRQSQKTSKQNSFKDILSQQGQLKNKLNNHKQSLASNSQPSSLLSSFELKNSRTKLSSKQINCNLINNKSKQQDALRETKQFKNYLSSDSKKYYRENIVCNEQTKSKYTKGVKVYELNITPATRQILYESQKSKHISNEDSLRKNKQGLNNCIEKSVSSRQLQRIQSQQSQESQSSSENQYIYTRQQNKLCFPKPAQIQTFCKTKPQIGSNNPNTFKQAMNSLYACLKPSQEIKKPNLIVRPKNTVFIRTAQPKQEQQIFTDPRLLKLIKDQMNPSNKRTLQNSRNRSHELRQTLGQYGIKHNLGFEINEKNKKVEKTFAQYSLHNQELSNSGFYVDKENMRYNQNGVHHKKSCQ